MVSYLRIHIWCEISCSCGQLTNIGEEWQLSIVKPENFGIGSLLLDQVMTLNSSMDMRHGNCVV